MASVPISKAVRAWRFPAAVHVSLEPFVGAGRKPVRRSRILFGSGAVPKCCIAIFPPQRGRPCAVFCLNP